MFVGCTARQSETFVISKRRLGLIRPSLRANWFGDQTLCVCVCCLEDDVIMTSPPL